MESKPNIALIIFDIVFLPIMILRLILIYFFGSKYNIKGMEFIDVMLHANNPYFNQENNVTIDVLHEDVRATVKRETKLFEEELLKENKKLSIEIPSDDEIENKKTIKHELKKIKNNKHISNITDFNMSEKILHIDSDDDINNSSENSSEIDSNSDNNSCNMNDKIENKSENILNTYTEESEIETETEIDKKNELDKQTNFNLDVHINKLFDDLENSMTIMTTEDEKLNIIYD